MDFSDALRGIKAGKRAYRKVWGEAERVSGAWVSLYKPEDPRVDPVIMVGYPDDEALRVFAGSNWDLLADDWEITE